MPRVVRDSDEDVETQGAGRKTRAAKAAAAASATDSPVRRSTRNARNLVQVIDLSPDSIVDDQQQPIVRQTRSRAATMDKLASAAVSRSTRSRKNSASSDLSETVDLEVDAGVRRVTRRTSATATPTKLNPRSRNLRAGSETKSTPPLARVKRVTRASSVEATGPSNESTGTPVRKRTRASIVPAEPAVKEEQEIVIETQASLENFNEETDQVVPREKSNKRSSKILKEIDQEISTVHQETLNDSGKFSMGSKKFEDSISDKSNASHENHNESTRRKSFASHSGASKLESCISDSKTSLKDNDAIDNELPIAIKHNSSLRIIDTFSCNEQVQVDLVNHESEFVDVESMSEPTDEPIIHTCYVNSPEKHNNDIFIENVVDRSKIDIKSSYVKLNRTSIVEKKLTEKCDNSCCPADLKDDRIDRNILNASNVITNAKTAIVLVNDCFKNEKPNLSPQTGKIEKLKLLKKSVDTVEKPTINKPLTQENDFLIDLADSDEDAIVDEKELALSGNENASKSVNEIDVNQINRACNQKQENNFFNDNEKMNVLDALIKDKVLVPIQNDHKSDASETRENSLVVNQTESKPILNLSIVVNQNDEETRISNQEKESMTDADVQDETIEYTAEQVIPVNEMNNTMENRDIEKSNLNVINKTVNITKICIQNDLERENKNLDLSICDNKENLFLENQFNMKSNNKSNNDSNNSSNSNSSIQNQNESLDVAAKNMINNELLSTLSKNTAVDNEYEKAKSLDSKQKNMNVVSVQRSEKVVECLSISNDNKSDPIVITEPIENWNKIKINKSVNHDFEIENNFATGNPNKLKSKLNHALDTDQNQEINAQVVKSNDSIVKMRDLQIERNVNQAAQDLEKNEIVSLALDSESDVEIEKLLQTIKSDLDAKISPTTKINKPVIPDTSLVNPASSDEILKGKIKKSFSKNSTYGVNQNLMTNIVLADSNSQSQHSLHSKQVECDSSNVIIGKNSNNMNSEPTLVIPPSNNVVCIVKTNELKQAHSLDNSNDETHNTLLNDFNDKMETENSSTEPVSNVVSNPESAASQEMDLKNLTTGLNDEIADTSVPRDSRMNNTNLFELLSGADKNQVYSAVTDVDGETTSLAEKGAMEEEPTGETSDQEEEPSSPPVEKKDSDKEVETDSDNDAQVLFQDIPAEDWTDKKSKTSLKPNEEEGDAAYHKNAKKQECSPSEKNQNVSDASLEDNESVVKKHSSKGVIDVEDETIKLDETKSDEEPSRIQDESDTDNDDDTPNRTTNKSINQSAKENSAKKLSVSLVDSSSNSTSSSKKIRKSFNKSLCKSLEQANNESEKLSTSPNNSMSSGKAASSNTSCEIEAETEVDQVISDNQDKKNMQVNQEASSKSKANKSLNASKINKSLAKNDSISNQSTPNVSRKSIQIEHDSASDESDSEKVVNVSGIKLNDQVNTSLDKSKKQDISCSQNDSSENALPLNNSKNFNLSKKMNGTSQEQDQNSISEEEMEVDTRQDEILSNSNQVEASVSLKKISPSKSVSKSFSKLSHIVDQDISTESEQDENEQISINSSRASLKKLVKNPFSNNSTKESDESYFKLNLSKKKSYNDEEQEKLDKSLQKSIDRIKFRNPSKPDYSMMAEVGSESDDYEVLPKFMFQSSDSNESGSEKSIDSDIAAEYNLAGKSGIKFEDDDVAADDCRASEEEYSDSDDEGSDLDDFIVSEDEENSGSESCNENEAEQDQDQDEKQDQEISNNSELETDIDILKSSTRNKSRNLDNSIQDLPDSIENNKDTQEKSLNSSKIFKDKYIDVSQSVKSHSTSKTIAEDIESNKTQNKKLVSYSKNLTSNTLSSSIRERSVNVCKFINNEIEHIIMEEETCTSSSESESQDDISDKICANHVSDSVVSQVEPSQDSYHLDTIQLPSKKDKLAVKKSKLTPLIECSTPKSDASKKTKLSKSFVDKTHLSCKSLSSRRKSGSLNDLTDTSKNSMLKIKDDVVIAASPEAGLQNRQPWKLIPLNQTTQVAEAETPNTKFLKKSKLNDSFPILESMKSSGLSDLNDPKKENLRSLKTKISSKIEKENKQELSMEKQALFESKSKKRKLADMSNSRGSLDDDSVLKNVKLNKKRARVEELAAQDIEVQPEQVFIECPGSKKNKKKKNKQVKVDDKSHKNEKVFEEVKFDDEPMETSHTSIKKSKKKNEQTEKNVQELLNVNEKPKKGKKSQEFQVRVKDSSENVSEKQKKNKKSQEFQVVEVFDSSEKALKKQKKKSKSQELQVEDVVLDSSESVSKKQKKKSKSQELQVEDVVLDSSESVSKKQKKKSKSQELLVEEVLDSSKDVSEKQKKKSKSQEFQVQVIDSSENALKKQKKKSKSQEFQVEEVPLIIENLTGKKNKKSKSQEIEQARGDLQSLSDDIQAQNSEVKKSKKSKVSLDTIKNTTEQQQLSVESVKPKKKKLRLSDEKSDQENLNIENINKSKKSTLSLSGSQETKKLKSKSKSGTSQASNDDNGIQEEARRLAVSSTMQQVEENVRTKKQARSKKVKEPHGERMQKEKEESSANKSLKRLSEDVLEQLVDEPTQRAIKRQKLSKTTERKISLSSFSPTKMLPPNVTVDEGFIPLSSTGGTTQFGVVNLQKAKKVAKKSEAVLNFRAKMLARNPRHPTGVYLTYLEKQQAKSGVQE